MCYMPTPNNALYLMLIIHVTELSSAAVGCQLRKEQFLPLLYLHW